ncbi:class F sortase [Paenarthrobacter sp. PH39-S1]|uniref:class F sortase n=1 Tax=Paenarthrobacter sp. PH39-S1 TaxID=3046204 RepID=UPI0024BA8AE3|nr:class F sortase [Paenarthrobacter sp. PH39-S1]MDJ0356107.1 sortase [Paenarthrobacter sp. PH39-S1]
MPEEEAHAADRPAQLSARRKRRRLAVVVLLILVTLLGALFLPQLSADVAATAPSTAFSTAPVPSPVPATLADPSAAPAVLPPGLAAAPPERLVYPATGIDLAVLPLTPTDAETNGQELDPPLTENAYWLTSYGMPGTGSTNSTYIVGHSWEGRDAPFNHLSAQAKAGDVFTVVTATGSLAYRVDSVITHDKDTLKDSDIWDVVPGRLILISCYTEDLWGRNVIVSASPVG